MSYLHLDRESLLVQVDARVLLRCVEASLAFEGLTLDLREVGDASVGDWLGAGAPGARSPWMDPCDHLVAGYVATIGRERVDIRPAPRRATGPDLFALVFGHRGRFATLHEVWLRVHTLGVARPVAATFIDESADSAPSDEECAMADAVAIAVAGAVTR